VVHLNTLHSPTVTIIPWLDPSLYTGAIHFTGQVTCSHISIEPKLPVMWPGPAAGYGTDSCWPVKSLNSLLNAG